MHASLKTLLISAVTVATGLILLQSYWITHEWKAANEIVQRQVDHAVQEAVSKELAERKDSLRHFLRALLRDTTCVRFSTLYSKATNTWTIKMADARNPADFTNFSHKKIPVDSIITEDQKERIIHHLVTTAVEEQIGRNTIMYYTQRFGQRWSNRFDSLSLNTSRLNTLLKQALATASISQPFYLQYFDTSQTRSNAATDKHHISSAFTGVQYHSVWDYDHNYVVRAVVKNPNLLLLQRLWVVVAASVLLVLLIIYYMFRTYKIIRSQKQLHEIKNDFIDNMTHELKTPLSTIHAAIDSLQYFKGIRDEQKLSRYLNTSRKELNKLNDIIDRILDISVYEKQTITLHKETIALVPLIEEIAAALRLQYKRQLEISSDNIPVDFEVYADRTHFANIIRNLLENAIKYVTGDLHICFSSGKDGGYDVISVQDNGPGIPASAQAFLFDKFYRISSNNIHNNKGFGLGLYYVKQITLSHGGSVSVKSKPGAGTTFIIKLPAFVYA